MAIIPARGGSKGLPGKNIRDLCGKPLVVWSIEKGLKSKYVDVAAVSADSPAIAADAKQRIEARDEVGWGAAITRFWENREAWTLK